MCRSENVGAPQGGWRGSGVYSKDVKRKQKLSSPHSVETHLGRITGWPYVKPSLMLIYILKAIDIIRSFSDKIILQMFLLQVRSSTHNVGVQSLPFLSGI